MTRIQRIAFSLIVAAGCLAVARVRAEPVVTNVTSTWTNGVYGLGTSILVTVQFDVPVDVTGSPRLELDTAGSSNATAIFASGSGTKDLVFEYIISRGQNAAVLDYTSTNALTTNAPQAAIEATGAPGTHATLTLPDLGAANSLGVQKALEVATPPIIMSITSTKGNGTYGTGEVINVRAIFSEAVNKNGAGTPLIELDTAGASNAFVPYTSGSGNTELDFTYTVGPGQQTYPAELDYVSTTALTTPSCSIAAFDDGLTADLTLPAPGAATSLSGTKNLIIDTPAVVTNVVSTMADGRYGLDNTIPILVQFSASVDNAGVAALQLNLGASSNVYAYSAGGASGTEIPFSYLVGPGQNATRLSYVNVGSLAGTFTKTASSIDDAVLLTLPAPGQPWSLSSNNNISIDTAGPVVTNYVPAVGATGVSSNAPLVLQFDQNLFKDLGSGTINIFRLSDTNLHESLDVASTNIQVTNTTVRIYFENSLASLTPYFVTVTNTAFHDDLTNYYAGITNSGTWYFTAADTAGPFVTNVTSTNLDGSYTVGANINVRVYFSEPIQHFGTHGIRLATGGAGRSATFMSLSGNYMDFRYTVQANDNSPDLQYSSINALTNDTGSTIQDLLGNDANLTLPALASPDSLAGNKAIVIDTIAPVITNVTSTNANGLYTTNVTLNVQVQYSEPVYVLGTPALRLETGGTDRDAVYISGDTTTNLVLEYVIQPGDWSTNLNYVTTNSFSNGFGGSIRDAAGNFARLGLKPLASTNALGGNKAIAIDTIRPFVLNTTSTNLDGHYRAGEDLDVRFEISEPVTVAGGTPQLALNSGPAAAAVYVSVLDNTNLVFTYTIASGENSSDLDYSSASALNALGALILDAAGNPLVTNLPAPGYPGSLSAAKDLIVDTVPPDVVVVSDSTSPTNGSPIVFIATFSETVSNFQVSAISLANGSLVPSNFAGQVGTVFRFHVVPSGFGSEVVQTLTVSLNAGAAQDLAGNLSTPSAPVNRVYDTIRPIGVMSSTSDNPTQVSPIPVRVLFSETMRDFTAPCVRATNAAVVNFAGSGVNFTFDLVPFQPGLVRANIDEGVAHDLAGNRCYPSAAFVRTYVFPSSAWLTASDGLYADRVALTWAAVSGATAYRVLRNTANDPYFAEYIGLASGGTAFNDVSATPGTLYYYWVRPVNVYGGIGEYSVSDTGWRGLAAPAGLTATDGAYADRIVVSWNASPSAAGYELYRATNASFAQAALIASPSGTSYGDTQVGIGLYYYWVRAINALGNSPFAGPESGWRIAFGDALNNTILQWRTGGSNVWFVQTLVSHDGVASAQSGAILDNQESWIETTAYGPGTLGFWWRVSSETNWDFLRFTINSNLQTQITGETGWQYLMFTLAEGANILRWNYVKDHSRSEGSDAAWLDQVTYVEIPRNLVASDGVYRDRVRLTWYGSFLAGTSYRIYRGVTANTGLAVWIADTAQAWYDDVGAVPGRIYYYWVQTISLHGSSSLGEPDQGHVRQVAYDYNADGRADLAAYDRAADAWYISTLTGTILAFDMPTGDADTSPATLVPADYDGDGAMDAGVYHEASGTWYVKTVASGQALVWAFAWGGPGCDPVPGDYDGDGRTDVAVFIRATGDWYVWPWTGAWGIAAWGWPGAEPVQADYDGDGRTDLAVFDRPNGRWFARGYLGDVLVWDLPWGWSTAVALPADYDGDGKADFGVYDAATGYWYILSASGTLLAWAVPWGSSQMIPVPADFDGDGRTDLAVYAPFTGNWYIWTWTGLAYTDVRWGVYPMEPVTLGR